MNEALLIMRWVVRGREEPCWKSCFQAFFFFLRSARELDRLQQRHGTAPLLGQQSSFAEAMKSQPKLGPLDSLPGYYAGAGLVAIGVVFVFSSFLALGFVGTFLGDYFGILMEAKVTCFPFSILDNPMYWGSTAIYLGWALMLASPAGLLLTAVVALCYTIALRYEGSHRGTRGLTCPVLRSRTLGAGHSGAVE
ncbi:phosphatidylethanolamine N-methyltransferase isoform X6 [Paroedura picta]|uniref:phosphatidylethanolamine N-methyltransferase isoform X6 n=1 Tax=Paroedura picta TaxID=143630 RepID=UPI004055E45A